MPLRRSAPIAVALLALTLGACSEAATEPTSALTPAAVADAPAHNLTGTTTTTGTTVTTCAGGTIVLTADEARSLTLHNNERARLGLTRFCVSTTLTNAARAHSRDMLAKAYFAHTAPTGETFVQRLVRFGYTPYRMLAENIAMGTGLLGNADYTFNRWMGSTGHRTNIQSAGLREIGIGVAVGTYGTLSNARTWTADFGTR